MDTRPKRRNRPAALRPERRGKAVLPCAEQERELARVLRGERTRGSGCGNDKGDAKSWFARAEAKTTGRASISVKMEHLCKICREAASDGKKPVFAFGFDNMPREFSSDWIAVPAAVFDTVCGVLTAASIGNFEEAARWTKLLLPPR